MKSKVTDKTKTLILVLLLFLNLCIFISILNLNRTHPYGSVVLFGIAFPLSTLSGTIQSLALVVCIVSVCIKQKLGMIFSGIYYVLSSVQMIIQLIVAHRVTVIPGIFNMVVSVATVSIIARQFYKIRFDKLTDFATGLPNMRGLYEILSDCVSKNKPFTVMNVQILNFKSLNDDVGHKYGDMILRETAERLKRTVETRGAVCKMDGAEFCIVLLGTNVDSVARHVISAVSKRIDLTINDITSHYYLDVRVGISEYPNHSTDYEELIKFADVALFNATSDSATKYRFFTSDMQKDISDYIDIIRKIRLALDNDYFYLVYQPQYLADKKTLRGFETLIRMQLPDGSKVSPGVFIEIAERTDLIESIDSYVLKKALLEFAPVFKKQNKNFIVSVNISAKSLAKPSFYENVRTMLTKIGFPASNLELEITEYSLGSDGGVAEANINALRNLGVKFALDDFGTGYTSLSRLTSLKVDLLKIDKSLIDNITTNKEMRAIVDSVIYMGHLMKCEVIAEGVEDESQLNVIKECNCDLVQGYIWGKPQTFEKAMTIINEQQG